MLSALLASVFLSALPPSPSDTEQSAYQTARDHAGRDPDAHVKLALWCERHGMDSERLRHLTLAVMADPQNTTARGLLGMVKDRDGHWVKTQQAVNPDHQDPQLLQALGEYNQKRASIDDHDPDDHWKLALWCEEHALNAEARAHFAAVVRLDPARDGAWKHLGCKKVNGHWMTDAQAKAEKAERDAQSEANRNWTSRLQKLHHDLSDPRKRSSAEQELLQISDPRAVPSIWRAFVTGRNPNASRAVQLLGQVRSPASSQALAWLVLGSESEEVRRKATETLATRDTREFLGLLIAAIRKPIRYEVRRVGGPGQPGALYIEGQAYNTMEFFRPWAMPQFMMRPGDRVTLDANGLPVVHEFFREMVNNSLRPGSYYAYSGSSSQTPSAFLASMPSNLAGIPMVNQFITESASSLFPTPPSTLPPGAMKGGEWLPVIEKDLQIPIGAMQAQAIQSARVAETQLEQQIASLDRANSAIRMRNDQLLLSLAPLSGQDFGDDSQAWAEWWTKEQGYSYEPTPEQPKPTLVEDIPLNLPAHTIRPTVVNDGIVEFVYHHSCFARGTPVQTRTGLKPIESIHLGDQVLTQDGATGKISYQPVIFTHHNPPSPTLRITLDQGESIVATPIHRFWRAGEGWAMARDLKAGDLIRTVDGLTRIDSISNERVQPVFNLEVASGQSFFVGNRGLLVHDNSLVEPVSHPFDQPAVLASAEKTAE